VALNVTIWPPRVAPDGGYPAAERAAARILERTGGERYLLAGPPQIKNADAYGFPLRRLGGQEVVPDDVAPGDVAPGVLVIACDGCSNRSSGHPAVVRRRMPGPPCCAWGRDCSSGSRHRRER